MYPVPIMRTYYSMAQYSQDAALMAAYGYRAVNVEQYNETNGLTLTLLLIFGLLLTPFCIGVVILCFLPFAFSKRYNVSYVFQPMPARPPIAPSYSQPLAPLYQPAAPPSYSQPLAQPYQPMMQPAQGYPAAPPEYQAQSTSLGTRFSAGLAYLRQGWNHLTLVQRGLVIVGIVVFAGVLLANMIYILMILSGGTFAL